MSRQNINAPVVAFHEHFGESGRESEVAVDLKRGVRVEQVGVGSAFFGESVAARIAALRRFDLILDQFVRVVAVEKMDPEADFPVWESSCII